jgi:uncharacterized protein YhdP
MTASATPIPARLAGALLAVLGIVVCAVVVAYLSVRHVVWPRLDDWRPQIVAQLGEQIGRPVSIDALRPGWEGLHPSLGIDGLRIDGEDGRPRLQVASAQALVSWSSLLRRQPRLARLTLEAPQLVVERLAPGRVAIAGF